MCFQVEEHISVGIYVSQAGEHISLGLCVSEYGNTYHYEYMFLGRGTHITRDMCFWLWEHISLRIRVSQVGEHITLGICVSKVGTTYH